MATRLPENIQRTDKGRMRGARDGTRQARAGQVRISRPLGSAKVALGGCNRYTRAATLHDGSRKNEATPRCISDRQRPDRDGPRTDPGHHRVWGQHQRKPDGEPRHRVCDAAARIRQLARPGQARNRAQAPDGDQQPVGPPAGAPSRRSPRTDMLPYSIDVGVPETRPASSRACRGSSPPAGSTSPRSPRASIRRRTPVRRCFPCR